MTLVHILYCQIDYYFSFDKLEGKFVMFVYYKEITVLITNSEG